MAELIEQLEQATVRLKANVYFEGKVISHTILTKEGRQTLGVIYPGTYTFNTEAPERMDIVAGVCRVRIGKEIAWTSFTVGKFFRVPGKSSFEIAVDQGLAEYLCTFE